MGEPLLFLLVAAAAIADRGPGIVKSPRRIRAAGSLLTSPGGV